MTEPTLFKMGVAALELTRKESGEVTWKVCAIRYDDTYKAAKTLLPEEYQRALTLKKKLVSKRRQTSLLWLSLEEFPMEFSKCRFSQS